MTTGRINQVCTKSPFSVQGTESMHTSPQQLETIFRPPSSRRRLPNGSRPRRAPTISPQLQSSGVVKTTPAPEKQARTKYSQEGKNPSKYLETAPENQNSRAEAAHAIEQEAGMHRTAAQPPQYTKRPPAQQQDHARAGRGVNPTTPTHKYYENCRSTL